MNKDLQSISDFIQQAAHLSDEEKKSILKSLKDANKELEITSFKLDRTEKVKRTTAILLEETIEELEKKRKAVEAQNKELEIESSLERVRTVAMSMNKPDDMLNVCQTIAEQLQLLQVKEIRNVQTAIFYKEKGAYMNYEYYAKHNKTFITHTTYTDHKIHQEFAEKMLKGNGEYMIAHINEEELKSWIDYQKTTNVFIDDYSYTASSLNYYWYSLGPVALGISTYVALNDDEINLFKRYLKVFELSYKRYLDIEKAEAQAKESQIEAALEQVRSRSLAMHKSEDIIEVARSVFEKLDALAVELNTAFIIVFKNDSRDSEWWLINRDDQHYSKVFVKYTDISVIKEQFDARDQGKELIAATYFADEKNRLFEYLFTETDFKYAPPERKKYIFESNALTLSMGLSKKIGIQITRHINKPFSSEENEILKRFTKVFDQSYTRFLDLQKAEAQAREARIEAALEKVRSRTLAMQKSDELAETAAEVFKQLIGLEIEPNRLYIGIVNGDTRDMEMWATDENGTRVGKKITFNAADNDSVKKLYDGWSSKIKSVTVDMQGAELENYINYLKRLQIPLSHALTQKRRVQSVAYFDKGFIGMASPDDQSEDSIRLLERFASVFNLTFTRFNDLKKAEANALQAKQDLIEIKAARKKAEEALIELQAAQKQLIQSEKMASLGELTAGIAHEIQNPLNFVNNFSEINAELIDELKGERQKAEGERNTVLEDELLNDIEENEKKINHHGKRADAIVKGMLQHSRSSTNVKEPTDINAVADEYLRLAYHGLRSKDNSFNATLKTDFDKSIGKINIIPQDIGRVLLNLYTNAFYAVGERRKELTAQEVTPFEKVSPLGQYEPTVSVSTKKSGNQVAISVSDNGNGIPQKIVDKIFQPFFTTKPTGQGTGLGLSLSYDIIKAHGGTIQVETKEGDGSDFIIQLPSV